MGELNKNYQLIVGDSPADFGEHWNGVRRKSNWAETHRHQLWIPAKLAGVASFRQSLHDWLFRHTNYGGGDRIELLTHSLSPESLADLRGYFQQHERAVHFDVVTPDQMANRQEQAEREHGEMNRFCHGLLTAMLLALLAPLTTKGCLFRNPIHCKVNSKTGAGW
jgi:hypothetical protein